MNLKDFLYFNNYIFIFAVIVIAIGFFLIFKKGKKKDSKFNDVRDTTVVNRLKIGFLSLDKKWQKAKAVFTDHTLKIEGHPVMEDWEDAYMKELSKVVCSNGGDILELGFGMGISAMYIQNHKVSSHTIIEANEDVYKKLIYFSFGTSEKIRPIFGFWQDVVKFIPDESFDGILFDTYPISKSEIHKNHFPFFKEAFRLLKDGGVLTYYSDEIDSFSNEHKECLKKAGFTDIKSFICRVNPPNDCKYWQSDKILVPIVFKKKKRRNQ